MNVKSSDASRIINRAYSRRKSILWIFIIISIFALFESTSFARKENYHPSYTIIDKEILKKGWQHEARITSKYVYIRIYAALKSSEGITEYNLKAVLDNIISVTRITDDPDAISIYLHKSIDNYDQGMVPIAFAEWWPQGLDVVPHNVANIENKSSHETRYEFKIY